MAEPPIYKDVNSAIIERCKKGEKRAFYELYQLYAKAMFNISFRILNDKSEAEEVLQDSFLKAFDRIKRYDPRFSFGIWLKKIVINGSLDALKKKKPLLVPLEESYYVQEDVSEEQVDFDVNTLKTFIGELPDGYRTILSLYLFENYAHKEIADLLGIHEGTSKSQYNRAKKKLIELIKQKTIHER